MFKEKSALVTGATSGIGKSIAEALASEGVKLFINGFGEDDAIAAVLDDLKKRSGQTAEHFNCDMSRPEEIEAMMKRIGSVDIVVNNAGIQFVSPIEDFPNDKWDAIIAINLNAAFHTTKAAVPHMKAKNWGRIVNIASAHSLVASPFKAAYVAAKHGIVGMTKSVALEVAEHGITVNAVSPGYVLTPLVEHQIPDTAKARGMSEEDVIKNVMLDPQPTKEFVSTEDIAQTVLFLCSDAGKSITGANLSIDGGWTAK